jgi:hypothetical protein
MARRKTNQREGIIETGALRMHLQPEVLAQSHVPKDLAEDFQELQTTHLLSQVIVALHIVS